MVFRSYEELAGGHSSPPSLAADYQQSLLCRACDAKAGAGLLRDVVAGLWATEQKARGTFAR
jgi:hypothetical protein